MKLFRKIALIVLLISLSLTILYTTSSLIYREYVEQNNNIKYFNSYYTKFNTLQGNFVPFGADNSFYDESLKYSNFLGVSFLSSDKDRNILYYNDLLGSTVYIKEEFQIPEFPNDTEIDEIIMQNFLTEEVKNITDKNDICEITSFLSSYHPICDNSQEEQIVFYAVSHKYGGIFQLNEFGSVYITNGNLISEIPQSIQRIINSD